MNIEIGKEYRYKGKEYVIVLNITGNKVLVQFKHNGFVFVALDTNLS